MSRRFLILLVSWVLVIAVLIIAAIALDEVSDGGNVCSKRWTIASPLTRRAITLHITNNYIPVDILVIDCAFSRYTFSSAKEASAFRPMTPLDEARSSYFKPGAQIPLRYANMPIFADSYTGLGTPQIAFAYRGTELRLITKIAHFTNSVLSEVGGGPILNVQPWPWDRESHTMLHISLPRHQTILLLLSASAILILVFLWTIRRHRKSLRGFPVVLEDKTGRKKPGE